MRTDVKKEEIVDQRNQNKAIWQDKEPWREIGCRQVSAPKGEMGKIKIVVPLPRSAHFLQINESINRPSVSLIPIDKMPDSQKNRAQTRIWTGKMNVVEILVHEKKRK